MERLVQLTPPSVEPVSLDLVKANCRVQHSQEDGLLRLWIKSAREYAEEETRRQLITATWKLTRACFPLHEHCLTFGHRQQDLLSGRSRVLHEQRLEICVTPVQAITSIEYYDAAGDLQALDEDEYQLAGDDVSAWLTPAPRTVWPATQLDRLDAVQISLRAGYGDTDAAVPALAQQAMLLMIGEWYLHREELASIIKPELPTAAQRLLAKMKTYRYR